ncbi:glycoside-pentoside-hexuronide (GPH):cation symporter [Agathobaculum massiliense]|uniref:glycoside-pentoside-hexuronide (GPH):cation symporter n=1 Tax=Agathobaculum massiliense TaxID=3014267 RepID=UPI000D1E7672|nr:glycoside-pentoside-hexuronide (GPH):cation symporter [Agathobaculum massiliense]
MDNETKVAVPPEKNYYHGGQAIAKKLAFASGELVYNLPWMLVSSYLAFFMTDIALIPAGAVSILFLVCRVWDAFNDPMIGSLADRTNTQMGRYRPWMLGGAIGLIPLVILLFWAHPDWSVGARTAYGCSLYFITVIASTSWNIPFSALNGVISPYPRERASFSSYRICISALACALSTALFIPLVTLFSGAEGNSVRGYLLAAVVVCALAIPFVFTCILGTKEVVKAPPKQKGQKMGGKAMANCFLQNPPLLIICLAFLVYGFLNYGRSTVGMYYFTYVWGDAGLFTLYATANGIVTAIAALFSATLVKLCHGKRGAMLFSYIFSFIVNFILVFLNPGNTSSTLVLVLLFIAGALNGFCTALLYGMIGDTVEYGQWKTGVRADGLCSSGTSFMLKLGGALAPTTLLTMLAMNGYVEGAASQTASALSSMNVVMNLIPAVLSIAGVILFACYKLNDKMHAQIIEDLKARGEFFVDE